MAAYDYDDNYGKQDEGDMEFWEFSAPGYYDFTAPPWIPPDDGYFSELQRPDKSGRWVTLPADVIASVERERRF